MTWQSDPGKPRLKVKVESLIVVSFRIRVSGGSPVINGPFRGGLGEALVLFFPVVVTSFLLAVPAFLD